MPNFESHIIVGHVGRSPELRYTPDGKAVSDFSVAVNNPFKPDAPATWYKITCWRKTAEFVNEYVQKGTAVLVESGELALDEWTDQDGNNRTTLVLTANRVQLVGGRGERENTAPQEEKEDLPF